VYGFILGALSFGLIPIVWEFSVELSHPVGPGIAGGTTMSCAYLVSSIFNIIFAKVADLVDGQHLLFLQ
jgi:hypothetical protein